MVCLCSVFSPPFLPVRAGLCNRLQRLPLSLSSFSITLCSCAGHQMTSSPPEELSSFFISAAAWLSPGQQPATQGEGTSACLRIRDRLPHFPSVSPQTGPLTSLLHHLLVILERTRRSDMRHCLCQAGQTDRGDGG